MRLRLAQGSRVAVFFAMLLPLIFYACRKEMANDDKANVIDKIRQSFEKTDWKQRLNSQFNDSLNIGWSPDWKSLSQKNDVDGITYYYIPLKGLLSFKADPNKTFKVNAVAFEEYIIVHQLGDGYSFQRASYVQQKEEQHEGRSSHIWDRDMDYGHFTGSVLLEDSSGKQVAGYYQQGKLSSKDGNNGRTGNPDLSLAVYKPNFDSINLDSLNPNPGYLPGFPMGDDDCSTRCVWSSVCYGSYGWNVSITIAPPHTSCLWPQSTQCGAIGATAWELVGSTEFGCNMPTGGAEGTGFPPIPPSGGGGGSTGTGTGTNTSTTVTDIRNDLEVGCLKTTTDLVIAKGWTNTIAQEVNRIFRVSNKYNLTFSHIKAWPKGYPPYDRTAAGVTFARVFNGVLKVDVYLNDSILQNATQEYIAATVLHEIAHGILEFNGIDGSSAQHNDMYQQYIGLMTEALREMFPGMPASDADGLSYEGLEKTIWGSALVAAFPEVWNRKVDIMEAYRYGRKGTSCIR